MYLYGYLTIYDLRNKMYYFQRRVHLCVAYIFLFVDTFCGYTYKQNKQNLIINTILNTYNNMFIKFNYFCN